MKKIAVISLCLAVLSLCSCGKTAPKTDAEASTTEAVEQATSSVFVEDDGVFKFTKADLPKGWTAQELYGTSTYLQAVYGEDENAPMVTVSVEYTKDKFGADKASTLATLVAEREKTDNAEEVKIGGLDFYMLHYGKSPLTYELFGQTKELVNDNYTFVKIQFTNVKDAKQFETLKGVLDVLDFQA